MLKKKRDEAREIKVAKQKERDRLANGVRKKEP